MRDTFTENGRIADQWNRHNEGLTLAAAGIENIAGDYDDPGAFEDWLKRRQPHCECGNLGHCDFCREMKAREKPGAERI